MKLLISYLELISFFIFGDVYYLLVILFVTKIYQIGIIGSDSFGNFTSMVRALNQYYDFLLLTLRSHLLCHTSLLKKRIGDRGGWNRDNFNFKLMDNG